MYSNAYIWSRVLNYLENHSPAVAVNTYFDDAEIVEFKEVVLDRPFVYMLIDCETNLPFFIGTMMNVNGD